MSEQDKKKQNEIMQYEYEEFDYKNSKDGDSTRERKKVEKINKIKEQVKERNKNKPAAKKTEEYIGQIPLKIIKQLYFVMVGALLFLSFTDYYNLAEPYLDFGSNEGVVFFSVFLVVLGVFSLRFYQFGIKKCDRFIHIVFIFFISSFVIELAIELYINYSEKITGFDNWIKHYHVGVEAYNSEKNILSRKLFKQSIKGLSAEGPNKQLIMKSFLYMALLDSREGKKEEALISLLKIEKELIKRPSEERIRLYANISTFYLRTDNLIKSKFYSEKCIRMIKRFPRVFFRLYYLCSYNSFVYDLIHLEKDYFPQAKEKWSKINNYYLNVYNLGANKTVRKKILKDIFIIYDLFEKKKYYDFVLDKYLNLLEIIRNGPFYEELHELYLKISHIYEKKGEYIKADVYRVWANDLKKEMDQNQEE